MFSFENLKSCIVCLEMLRFILFKGFQLDAENVYICTGQGPIIAKIAHNLSLVALK